MNKSESIKELAQALSAAQAEMPAVKMNAVNPFLKNKYADLGAVIDTARPILGKHGLSVSQMVGGDGATVTVTTLVMHKSGEWLESTVGMAIGEERGKSAAQVAGSIVTYLRRYSLASALGMYADEDGDGNGHKPEQPRPQSQPDHRPQAEPEPMTLKQAEDTLSSDGKRYGDRKTEELVQVANNPKTPAEKKLAAQLILKARSEKGQ